MSEDIAIYLSSHCRASSGALLHEKPFSPLALMVVVGGGVELVSKDAIYIYIYITSKTVLNIYAQGSGVRNVLC